MGGPPKIFGVLGIAQLPKKSLFIAFLRKNFQKIWSFRSGNFPEIFRKRSKNFSNFQKKLKFFNFLKIEKTMIFASKFVQNHHIDLDLDNFPLKLQKSANFHIKPSNFSKFSAPSAPKVWSFRSLHTRFFWSWGYPLLDNGDIGR